MTAVALSANDGEMHWCEGYGLMCTLGALTTDLWYRMEQSQCK